MPAGAAVHPPQEGQQGEQRVESTLDFPLFPDAMFRVERPRTAPDVHPGGWTFGDAQPKRMTGGGEQGGAQEPGG
jgi:hypothetical protein